MSGAVFRVAWYRFLATFGHRWAGYLTVVLLVGLVGGVAMGAVAGARRTQSSFPAYLASTNPSDLSILTTESDVPRLRPGRRRDGGPPARRAPHGDLGRVPVGPATGARWRPGQERERWRRPERATGLRRQRER